MSKDSALTEHSYWEQGWVAHGKPRKVNLKRYFDRRVARFFDKYLPSSPLLAMEVGAGNSIWLPYMAEVYGYSVVGIDYSKTGCDLLRANLELRGQLNKSLIVQGDIFQPCLKPQLFDVIFSNGLIEHFANYEDVLILFKSWLKPGGLLISFVPNKKHFFRGIERRLAPDIYDAHIFFEPDVLQKAYENVGMESIEASYLGSFSTWKYISYARGGTRIILQVLARLLNGSVHAVLQLVHAEPESKNFSPLIFVVGRTPTTL